MRQNVNFTERMEFVIAMMASAGIMDAYSYIQRGQVFATGQTGNFTLMAIRIVQNDWMGFLYTVLAVVAFWIGIFICWHVFYTIGEENDRRWKKIVLVIEFVLLAIVGFLPDTIPDFFVNPIISLAAAFQFCAFRKMGTNDTYASVFCTGNMRTCAESYYLGLVKKDREALRRANRFSLILISFFSGAILTGILCRFIQEKAIWAVNLLFIFLYCYSGILNFRRRR
ncbi:MAG: YoaK family protein [Lachnospira sp.]